MKIYKYIIISFLTLIITNCDSDNPYISNDISTVQYTANFQPHNAGTNKYSVTVKWNKYRGNSALYEIFNSDGNLIESITSKSDTSSLISMDLNEIKVVSLSVNNLDYGSIKVFSRPVSPITNFSISASSQSNVLSWTRSSDNDIQQTIIYRAELDPSSSLPLINENNGTPDGNIWTIIKQGNGTLSSYTDSDINTSFNYYYIIKVVDSSGNYRYGYMTSNIGGSVESGDIIGVDSGYSINLQSSEQVLDEIYSNKASFFWQDYNYADFYTFEIWRSEEANFEIGSDESTQIIIITNPLVVDFQDYNNIGEGKTWYYKIRLTNIYGNYIDSDIITCQTSL